MRQVIVLVGLCAAGYFGWASYWGGGREAAAVRGQQDQAAADGWSRRRCQGFEFCLPPGWEQRHTNQPAADDAVFADGTSAAALPPVLIVALLTDPKGRPLDVGVRDLDAANRQTRPGYETIDIQAGRLPSGLTYARLDSVFNPKGKRVRECEWTFDTGGDRRVSVSGTSEETDWAAFEPVLTRIVETFGPAGPPPAGGPPVTARTDAEIRDTARLLSGTDADRARGLRAVAAERGAVWLRACDLWAAAAARDDRAAATDYQEALMILAFIDPDRGSLDAFGADPFKTAALKPAILDAVLAALAARPADDQLRPVLDGLHLIARRADPGVVRRFMAARAAASDARGKQVAEYAVQAWGAGKLLLLQGEARWTGGVFDPTPPAVPAVVGEIVAGGEVTRAQIAEGLPRVRDRVRDADPEVRADATAELSVLTYVQTKFGKP